MSKIAIFICIGICAWSLNYFLGYLQIKNFNREFIDLRRKGKVAVGRKKGSFVSGSVVLFLITDEGEIIEGKLLYGTSVLARVRDFNKFNNRTLASIKSDELKGVKGPLKKSILDAKKNYEFFLTEKEKENARNI